MYTVYSPHRTGTKRYVPKLQALLWQRDHLLDTADAERTAAQRHYESAQRLDVAQRQQTIDRVIQYYARRMLAYRLLGAAVERYWRTVCIGARHMADAPVPVAVVLSVPAPPPPPPPPQAESTDASDDEEDVVSEGGATYFTMVRPPTPPFAPVTEPAADMPVPVQQPVPRLYATDYEMCHLAWEDLADRVADAYRQAATLLATLSDPTASAHDMERAYRYLRAWAELAERHCAEAEQCMCGEWHGFDPSAAGSEDTDPFLLPLRLPEVWRQRVAADTDAPPVECVTLISRRTGAVGERIDVCLPDCSASDDRALRSALHDYDTRTVRLDDFTPATEVAVEAAATAATNAVSSQPIEETEKKEADMDKDGFVTIHVDLDVSSAPTW